MPKELRKPVRAELAKRATPELDRSALYYAVSAAAASVAETEQQESPSVRFWEQAYEAACEENGFYRVELGGR